MTKTLVNLSVRLFDNNKPKRYQLLFSPANVNADFICKWTWDKGEDLVSFETVSVKSFNLSRIRKMKGD